jgi:hypothetical protein
MDCTIAEPAEPLGATAIIIIIFLRCSSTYYIPEIILRAEIRVYRPCRNMLHGSVNLATFMHHNISLPSFTGPILTNDDTWGAPTSNLTSMFSHPSYFQWRRKTKPFYGDPNTASPCGTDINDWRHIHSLLDLRDALPPIQTHIGWQAAFRGVHPTDYCQQPYSKEFSGEFNLGNIVIHDFLLCTLPISLEACIKNVMGMFYKLDCRPFPISATQLINVATTKISMRAAADFSTHREAVSLARRAFPEDSHAAKTIHVSLILTSATRATSCIILDATAAPDNSSDTQSRALATTYPSSCGCGPSHTHQQSESVLGSHQ